jgi:hypothetical protein
LPNYFLPAFGLPLPRLSAFERRSPSRAFAFSDRVSTPDRLSLPVRLWAVGRLLLLSIPTLQWFAENQNGTSLDHALMTPNETAGVFTALRMGPLPAAEKREKLNVKDIHRRSSP